MDGYGRWIALVLFISLLVFVNWDDWKRYKWEEIILFMLYLLGGLIIVAILIFIYNFW